MVARFFVPRDDLRAYEADVWEQNQLTKVADQWEKSALQRLDEQFAPPPVAPPQPAPDDWLKQQQQRLGWAAPATELSQPFEQSTEHVQRLTSQVNPSIAAPSPEPEPAPVQAPAATLPDLRSLNTTGEQYTPPPGAAPPSTTTPALTPSGNLVDYARQAAQRAGIDPDLFVRQINQESGFQTRAQSGAGARGIAQIVPRFHPNVNPDNPTEALDYAANLMASHKRTYGRDDLALVAYNGGQGAVDAYLSGKPYAESQKYVANILGGAGGPTPTASTQDPDKVAAMQSGDWEQVAKAQLGKPYIWGSKGGRSDFSDSAVGFDCSGFVSYVWRNGLGVNMPAFTGDIQKATQGIKSEDAQPGDLVMLMNSSDPTRQHVGIYIGNGQMINSTGGGVQVEPVWKGMEFRRDPRLADRPGSALGIVDTASETAELRPNTPEEQQRNQVAKQSLAPEPEAGPLEQITNPFGEAFRQVSGVVGDVGGGALEGLRQAITAPVPAQPALPADDAFLGRAGEGIVGGVREFFGGVGTDIRRQQQEAQAINPYIAGAPGGGFSDPGMAITAGLERAGVPGHQEFGFATPKAQVGPLELGLEVGPRELAGFASGLLPSGALPAKAAQEIAEAAGPGVARAATRAARSRLPAEAEAGFAAGMPTGGRRPPDIPTPPPGAAAAPAADVFAAPTGPVNTASILDSANYKRLLQMRGTAEEAAELAPERPGFAGNINLDKITPDDVKVALQQAAEDNNLFAGQRRGVITDPEARQNAARVALNMAPEDWIKTKPGRAFNQEEALALGETMVRTGSDYTTMRAALDAAEEAGTATDLMRAATADKALEMALLEGVRSGAASEAGRALRSFRTALEGALRNKANDPAKAFSTALKAIGTDEARYAEWVKAWDAMPADNVVGKYQLLQALHEPTKMNKLVAFTTSNMLSGNKTLEVNLVGGGIETINRPLIELLGGRPVDAWTDLTAMGRAIGQGFANAGTALKTGVRPSQAARSLAEGRYDNVRPEAFGGKLGLVATPALRVMSATDEFMRTINSAGGLAVAARREARATGKTVQEILSDPPEHVLKFAQDAADEAVFEGGGTPFSKGVGAWRNLINSSNPLERTAGVAGHVLFPFVNIPEQILIRGGRMLPGINEASTIMQIRKGLQSGDQQVVRDAVGRYVLTDAVLLATGSQVLAGNITGNGPKDAQKRASLEGARDENGNKIWQAHSIKVGDRWIDYTNLGPVAIPLATISNAHEAYLESGKRPGANEVVDVFNRVGDTMLDATYIKSFGELMKAIGEGNAYKAAGSLIGNVVSRGVPVGGALASAARVTDQETKQPTNLPEYLMSRIPDVPGFGVVPSPFPISSRVADKPSPFGGSMQQPQDVAAALSPFRTSATGETEPLARAFVNAGMGAPTAPATISMTNQATRQASPPMALNDEEKRQYMQLMGDRLRENAQASINSPKWQQEAAALRSKPADEWTAADHQIAEAHKKSLQNMTEAAREYAKAQIYQSWTPEERQRRMTEGAGARQAEPILGR